MILTRLLCYYKQVERAEGSAMWEPNRPGCHRMLSFSQLPRGPRVLSGHVTFVFLPWGTKPTWMQQAFWDMGPLNQADCTGASCKQEQPESIQSGIIVGTHSLNPTHRFKKVYLQKDTPLIAYSNINLETLFESSTKLHIEKSVLAFICPNTIKIGDNFKGKWWEITAHTQLLSPEN